MNGTMQGATVFWDDLPEALRLAIHWDGGYWYQTATGRTIHGCGCSVHRSGETELCEYHRVKGSAVTTSTDASRQEG